MRDILASAQRFTDRAYTVKRLADWLQNEIDKRGWSRREAARQTNISYTALTAIIKGETEVPELENLDKLAKKFDVPLARLVEYCEYDLGFTVPADRQQYIVQLIARQPEYQSAVEGLLSLTPSDFEAAVKHIEALRQMHDKNGRQSDRDGEKL